MPGGGAADVPPQSGPPAHKKKKASKGKKAAAKESSSSSSSAGSDSSSDSASEPTVVVDAEAPLASMPDVLGSGAAFAALVAARCNRSWVPLSVIENAVPVAYRCHVILSKMWSSKDRQAYDKLVKGQRRERHRGQRRENLVLVACPHRLSFAFSNDSAVVLEARHLVMVCAVENFSDWAGEDGPKFGGSRGKADYEYMLKELRTSWDLHSRAVELRQHVGAPASSTLFTRVYAILERRYGRFAAILRPGRVREEILANVARQLAEIHVHFGASNRSLADRCERKPYEEQALFTGSRYVLLLGPLVSFLLDADEGLAEPATLPGSLGGSAPSASDSATADPVIPSAPLLPQLAACWPPDSRTAPPRACPPHRRRRPSWRSTQLARAKAGGRATRSTPYTHLRTSPRRVQLSRRHHPRAPRRQLRPATGTATPARFLVRRRRPPQPPRNRPSSPSRWSRLSQLLSQPMHVYVTGVGYNCVPAGEVRSPACGCGAKHGPNYRPGPHATWDCQFSYMARYGSCPGFLANGQRDPGHWHHDSLTRRAKDLWVKLIKDLNLGVPLGPEYRPVNFSL